MTDDQVGNAGANDVVAAAFATARDLLRHAEDDAARVRAAADLYVRQREKEAELLVANARRVLAAAEQKATSMTGAARGTLAQEIDVPVIVDLDANVATASPVRRFDRRAPAHRGAGVGIDSILASAIGKAVDKAFPLDP